MSLFFNMLSKLVIDFLPRSKHLLISWLQSPSAELAAMFSVIGFLRLSSREMHFLGVCL